MEAPATGHEPEGSSSPSSEAAPRGVPSPPFAAMVLNRICYGPRPGSAETDIAAFNALGANDAVRLQAFVDRQLNPLGIPDADVEQRLQHSAYVTLNKPLPQLWQDHRINGNSGGPGGSYWRDWPIREGERAAFVRAIYSERQLFEILVEFWHDHLNVYGSGDYAQSVWSSWDRDVIRAHVLGRFRDMLIASSQHAAMLHYLDNYVNRVAGPNENYARELIELHTLGAENYLGIMQQSAVPSIPAGEPGAGLPVGYVDADVYEATRILTGWKVNDGGSASIANDGSHYYHEAWHDRFQKTVLGLFFPANTAGTAEVPTLLVHLAHHPGTARHIAGKLCRRLIGDNPPQAVIDRAAKVFWEQRDAADQIKQTVREILLYTGEDDPAAGNQFVPGCFRDVSAWGGKMKRPFETIVSSLRACSAHFTIRRGDGESDSFMSRVARTGHRPFNWRPPDGHPDDRAFWRGSTSLVQAWRTVDWVLDENQAAPQIVAGDELIPIIAVTFNEFSADRSQHTPNKLADFWMKRIYGWAPDPVQGWRGTALHEDITRFLRRNRNGVSYWEADAAIGSGGQGNTDGIETFTSPEYWRTRMRGMVLLILSSRLFMQR